MKTIKDKRKIEYLTRWIRLNQIGVSVYELVKARGDKNIALYGFNELAICLIYELKETELEIKTIIDKKAGKIQFSIFQTVLDKVPKDVDTIIITLTDDLEIRKLKAEIRELYNIKVYDIGELLYGL